MNLQLLLLRLKKLIHTLPSPRLLRALFSEGVLASAEHRRILSDDLLTIVDIGANKGQFSLAARRWSPRTEVIAFEPLAGAAAKFQRVFAGDTHVRLHQVAIGSDGGEQVIHVSAADDSSSLLPISKLQTELYPGTSEVAQETVKVGRLHEFVTADEIQSPALLKIDVQGYELEALQGCAELIARFEKLLVECSFVELYEGQALAHEIIRFLDAQGFVLSSIYNLEYDRRGQAVQGDFVFVRSGN